MNISRVTKAVLLSACVLLPSLVAGELPKPIPELKLTNGATLRNVTVVRYERERVVLRASGSVGPISYTLIPQPIRAQWESERDAESESKDAVRQAAQARENQSVAVETERVNEDKACEEAVSRHSIRQGMTEAQVERSWGIPARKSAYTGTAGQSAQWIYSRPDVNWFLYFSDGRLRSWSRHSDRPE